MTLPSPSLPDLRSKHRRLQNICLVGVLLALLVALNIGNGPNAYGAAGPPQVTLQNKDGQALEVVVDGRVVAPKLPSGRSTSFVLDEGEHRITVGAVGSPLRSNPLVATFVGGETIEVDATAGRVLIVTSKRAVGNAFALVAEPERLPLRPTNPSFPLLLLGIFGTAAITAAGLAHLGIEREKIRDERASLRMQALAARSLSSLPPLSMDLAARRAKRT